MKEFVFSKEFFTFHEKWKLFRNIINNQEIYLAKDIDLSRLKSELKETIEIRNNFAHGEFTFTKYKAYLEFKKNGSVQKFEVNEEYFEYLIDKFNKILADLQTIIFSNR
jgi:hypothetical protein